MESGELSSMSLSVDLLNEYIHMYICLFVKMILHSKYSIKEILISYIYVFGVTIEVTLSVEVELEIEKGLRVT